MRLECRTHTEGYRGVEALDVQGVDGAKGDEDLTSRDYWVGHLGSTIKRRRVGRCTVEELSAQAGVSAGLISQIERGIGNPSFATLLRLANALEIPLASMFEGLGPQEATPVVRKQERLRLEIPAEGLVQEILVPNGDRKLGMISMRIPPGFRGEDTPHSHPGEETILVLSGSYTANLGGEAYELHEGDTLTYDSSIPHWWNNHTDQPAEVIAASTPPSMGRTHS